MADTSAPDLHSIQLALVELRTQMQAQTQRTAETIEGLMDAMRETRNEVASVSRRLEDVSTLRVSHEQQNDAIARAFKAIKELADNTKAGFERRDSEHGKTRDKVVWATGAAFMLSLLASSCVALVMYYTNQADVYQQRDRDRIEQMVKDNTTRIRTLEAYVPYPTTPRP